MISLKHSQNRSAEPSRSLTTDYNTLTHLLQRFVDIHGPSLLADCAELNPTPWLAFPRPLKTSFIDNVALLFGFDSPASISVYERRCGDFEVWVSKSKMTSVDLEKVEELVGMFKTGVEKVSKNGPDVPEPTLRVLFESSFEAVFRCCQGQILSRIRELKLHAAKFLEACDAILFDFAQTKKERAYVERLKRLDKFVENGEKLSREQLEALLDMKDELNSSDVWIVKHRLAVVRAGAGAYMAACLMETWKILDRNEFEEKDLNSTTFAKTDLEFSLYSTPEYSGDEESLKDIYHAIHCSLRLLLRSVFFRKSLEAVNSDIINPESEVGRCISNLCAYEEAINDIWRMLLWKAPRPHSYTDDQVVFKVKIIVLRGVEEDEEADDGEEVEKDSQDQALSVPDASSAWGL